MTKDAKFGSVGGGDCEDETVEKSPLKSRNLNRLTDYLTPEARLAFT